MRLVLIAIVLTSVACRRDAATGTAPAGGVSRSASAAPVATLAGHPSGVSDDELVAFTRWQRDFTNLLRQHRAELDAMGSADPAAALRDTKAFEAQVAELVARQAPVMRAQLERVPLEGPKAELVTEAIGGIFHFGSQASTFELVIARDEVRLEAARRRFGKEAIDDLVAREALILAALQGP